MENAIHGIRQWEFSLSWIFADYFFFDEQFKAMES